MKEGWSQIDYCVPASKAEREKRIERGAGQYVGMGRVMAVLRRDAPHKDTGT